MNKKYLSCILASLIAFPTFACWYAKKNYNDYIFSVNGIERHVSIVKQIEAGSSKVNSITYDVKNNIKADFPLTITMKLTSEEPMIIEPESSSPSSSPESRRIPIEAKLQYRILPAGKWVTVSEYKIDSGRLPASYPPAPYLGRNNIEPKGLKAGDKIMVRLYVTDNAGWQSGDEDSFCDEALDGETQPIYTKDHMHYTVTNKVEPNYDMGSGWYPHYVVVVEYTGYTRPKQ